MNGTTDTTSRRALQRDGPAVSKSLKPNLNRYFGLVVVCFASVGTVVECKVSKPGGAGHALLFNNHAVVLKDFNLGGDTNEFTFEAWVSTTDTCHSGTLMSYALKGKAADDKQRAIDYNHFFISNPGNLLACHDFEWQWIGDTWAGTDYWAQQRRESCAYYFNHTTSIVDRTGDWHHIAVTWTAANDGTTKIYKDGLLMKEAKTGKKNPIQSGGAMMLGSEQDCYGGCTEEDQSYFGLMDEVRIWKVARNQEEIMKHMRNGEGLERDHNLVAYWKFDDPDGDTGIAKWHDRAMDSSSYGNHLPLVSVPLRDDIIIAQGDQSFSTGFLRFDNNYALAENVKAMPEKDISIEMWAKTAEYTGYGEDKGQLHQTILTYSTHGASDSETDPSPEDASLKLFQSGAIRIEKVYEMVIPDLYGPGGTPFWAATHSRDNATAFGGSLMIHLNNKRSNTAMLVDNWIFYRVNWNDGNWHHIAFTWSYDSGLTTLYFDGKPVEPYASNAGQRPQPYSYKRSSGSSNNDAHLSPQTARSSQGSFVLGQNQYCYGGCFSPDEAYRGELANVRIWGKVLSKEEVSANMFKNDLEGEATGLVANYVFSDKGITKVGDRGVAKNSGKNDFDPLYLWADAPRWEYSTAPLTRSDGHRVKGPEPGDAGTALQLNDQQVLMTTNFQNWPDRELTVEFWMWSLDSCRQGAPVSYATGDYAEGDNMFGIFNYNNWQVAVDEDEGHSALAGSAESGEEFRTPEGFIEYADYADDDASGISATDGRWHHIAVTWRSSDGVTSLYDNGRLMWVTVRAKGKTLQSGGTLIIGREQDCKGGCFDSGRGAVGPLDNSWEHGSQDFYGVIDEMRIWRKARSADEIYESAAKRLLTVGPGVNSSSYRGDPYLTAYWQFDEADGFVVHDITGNGHDLYMSSPPQWQVVRWASTCGDGIVEGLEQCDVGDNKGDRGCDPDCRVTPGWDCSAHSPSRCWKLPPGASPRISARERVGKTSKWHHPHRGIWAFLGMVTGILLALTIVGGAVWVNRERLADLWRERDLGWRLRHKPRGPIEYEALLDAPDADAEVSLTPPR